MGYQPPPPPDAPPPPGGYTPSGTPGAPGPYPTAPPVAEPSNGTAALIVTIVGVLICWPAAFVGAIMGGSAKKKLQAAGRTDTGIATAAQVIGWIWGILGLIGTILVILFVFVLGGAAVNQSNEAGAVADRFLANAAAGNVAGMRADSVPSMSPAELENVSDYLSAQIGSTVISTTRTSTNIYTSGGVTEADLSIQVTGPNGTANAAFNLVKSGGQFKVQNVSVV